MDFQLREWRESDAPSLAKYADNPRISANLRDIFPSPYTLSDAESYISSCQKADRESQLLYTIVVEGRSAGSIGVFRKNDVYRMSAELGYFLAEPYWGRGIMSAAVRQICEETFAKWDIVRIFAEPFAHNAGSGRVLEKAGFVCEGLLRTSVYKNGVYHDSCIYARVIGGSNTDGT